MGSDAAAWLQAIGSIAAIGSGFAYHAWQTNLGLRQRLQIAVDAIDQANAELAKAQDAARPNFPSFDTSRLLSVVDCLEASCTIVAASLSDQLSVRSIVSALRQYIDLWDADTSRLEFRDIVARNIDVMDLDGTFEESMTSARDALSQSIQRLRKNPFRTY